ncbi:septum site-determining protein MinC [Clostridium homopropionicum DSM 5847]|uniref:Probable septum site-determining protein MinC n=1 Tax=Clostridium homopropionicum DSM 5847 TaxID=1121318 RepID=A0A0L6ZB23_9CLOT|nr:septum site-determining protein MinC [Clostridium homopropionicum]KOA20174.1 septum site-determining protein MinC [Clostridium homopropionicum DSM 5847]SFG60344.1 septum site-determining protein MinC [Clostridium homopropionicum]
MLVDGIIIKGNREGLVAIIDMNKFRDFEDMLEKLIEKLNVGKKFYKGATIKISTQLKEFNEKQIIILKDKLFDEFLIKGCIFEEKDEVSNKVFQGIYEGRTKFYRKTLRSGQIIRYPGNVVIIGDVNPGAEVYAGGNVIVLGNLQGNVYAGNSGNTKAIISAFRLYPQILQIANIITRSPENDEKPYYPEVAKIKDDTIIVEPYIPNKFV